jgi:hypothetical protein
VSRSTILRQPLAQATESDASSLLDDRLRVLKTGVDDRPELIDMRSDELGATLDGYTESHEGGLPGGGVRGGHVGGDISVKGGEDLSRGKSLSEDVEDSESELEKGRGGGALSWVGKGLNR